MKRHCEFGTQIIAPLANDEWNVFKKHTSIGQDIMQACRSPIMQLASIIAESHHERWDGAGYPRGLT
ncbi:MAG: two-component system response regulator, partial [Pirellulales bacterium]